MFSITYTPAHIVYNTQKKTEKNRKNGKITTVNPHRNEMYLLLHHRLRP